MKTDATFSEAYDAEIERVQALIREYDSLPGGVGRFGSMMLQEDVRQAKAARNTGDVVGMLRCYAALQGCE